MTPKEQKELYDKLFDEYLNLPTYSDEELAAIMALADLAEEMEKVDLHQYWLGCIERRKIARGELA
jgi:hypothetical protein